MSKIINIHHIMINHREKGLFIKIWANIIAMYHICGQGSHGKIDQAIAIIHKINLSNVVIQNAWKAHKKESSSFPKSINLNTLSNSIVILKIKLI